MHGWIPLLFMDETPVTAEVTGQFIIASTGHLEIIVGVVRNLPEQSVEASAGHFDTTISRIVDIVGPVAEAFPGKFQVGAGVDVTLTGCSVEAIGNVTVASTKVVSAPQLVALIETSSLAFIPTIRQQPQDTYCNGNGAGQVIYGISKRKVNPTGSGTHRQRPLQLAKTFPVEASAHGLFEMSIRSMQPEGAFLYRSRNGLLAITNDTEIAAAMLVQDGDTFAIPMSQPQEIFLDRSVVFTEDRY